MGYKIGGVHNHVKLEIHFFFMNFNSRGGVSKGTVEWILAMGLADLGDSRPALPEGRKYQMVKAQTWTDGICHTGFWGFFQAL